MLEGTPACGAPQARPHSIARNTIKREAYAYHHLTRTDRYRKALELLNAAHRDVTMEEDNGCAEGLQGRVIAEADRAHRIVERLQPRYH